MKKKVVCGSQILVCVALMFLLAVTVLADIQLNNLPY